MTALTTGYQRTVAKSAMDEQKTLREKWTGHKVKVLSGRFASQIGVVEDVSLDVECGLWSFTVIFARIGYFDRMRYYASELDVQP